MLYSKLTKFLLCSIIAVLCTISAVAQPPQKDENPRVNDEFLTYSNLRDLAEYMKDYYTAVPPELDQTCDSVAFNRATGCKDWGDWQYDTYCIYHPKFPDCPIYVNFLQRICKSDGRTFQIKILDFGIEYESEDCKGFKEYLEQPGALNQFEHDLFSLISRKIFVIANLGYMNLPEGVRDTLYCTYPDGKPRENNVRVFFVKSSCRAFCYAMYGIKGEGVGEIISYRPFLCEGTSCCMYVNEFCIDRETKQLRQNEKKVSIVNGNSGCDIPISNTDCLKLFPEGNGWHIISIGHTECRPSCDLNTIYMDDEVIIGE